MEKQKFFFYATGIFFSYLYFGVVQEKITRGKYSYEETKNGKTVTHTEKFVYALTLVFVQCIINFIVARMAASIWPQGEDKTHKLYYASMSLTYLLAMVCSNMALQWVSYPTQVIGKSAKPIPVMILGVLLGKKKYPFTKYIFVCMLVFGVVLFMLKDKAVAASEDDALIGVGDLLLILSLLMDGLTGGIQVK